MALVGKATTGFELLMNVGYGTDYGRYYEMTPSLAVRRGDMLVLTNGKVALAAANADNVLGVAVETKTAHATDVTYIRVFDNPHNVYRCAFVDHIDSTASAAGATTTLIDTVALNAFSTDGHLVGALLYVYAGPGKGEKRTISAYTGSTRQMAWVDPLGSAITTDSKYIVLGNFGGSGKVINVGTTGVDLKDHRRIDSNADLLGPLTVRDINPSDLTMDVVITKHLFR